MTGSEASARRARRNVVLTAAIAGPAADTYGRRLMILFAAGVFIVSLTFLLLIEALGRSGAFWFYGAIGILTLIFCWKFVPETKGKRLEDIEAYFQARVKS